jgi:hypothetical protein
MADVELLYICFSKLHFMNTTLKLIIGLSILIFSCKSNKANFEGGSLEKVALTANMDNLSSEVIPAPEKEFDKSISTTVISRKIIKDGNMEIRVKNLEHGKAGIDSLVKKFHGYYAQETYNNQDYSHDFSLKIRIPSDNFEVFIAQAESAIGEMIFKNISSRDVTEEFIDLETRLKNKKNYLNRYGELLKQAKSVKDILEIEEKTRGIEEEIESTEGRLKFLNNEVDFSTLELRITRKNDYNFKPRDEGKFFDRLKFSLAKGWFGLVAFTLFVIRLWPFWIIVSLLYYLVRKILQRRKRKQT